MWLGKIVEDIPDDAPLGARQFERQVFDEGADAIITFPNVYWDMLKSPYTDQWNRDFRDAWTELEDRGQLKGFVSE